MCGIAAIFGTKKKEFSKIKSMISSISHRGPDGQGFYTDDYVSLGSCRLSIFDFSEKGNMPMNDNSKRYYIVYNGEIYNFKELKKKYNISTKSNTDTEVLIELFAKINVKCFEELNGIFAFIIFDKLEKKVYCVRDRFGVKPLYYTKNKDTYYFCSEIKGIKSTINNVQINLDIVKFYLHTSFYDSTKESFYKNINQVEHSSYMIFDLNKKESIKRKFWDLEISNNQDNSFNTLDKYFVDSFSLQQRTDSNLGLNISSGLDSNLMISYLNLINKGQNNISANSYYFSDPEFDHRNDLKEMSEHYGWKINTHEITSSDVINKFEKVFDSQDEPFPGIVTIAKDILIEKSYSNETKVILEGQGGDEIGAGYRYVFPLHILDLVKTLNMKKVYHQIKKFNSNENIRNNEFINFFYNSLKGYLIGGISADGTQSKMGEILQSNINHDQSLIYKNLRGKIDKNLNFLKTILYRDIFYCKLPRILRSCDRSSMAHGKELRVPLLDHNIVKFFFNLNNENLINDGHMRHYYRKFVSQKFISNKLVNKKKYYVSDPQTKWLKTSLFQWAYDNLTRNNSFIGLFVKKDHLKKYLNDFKNNSNIKNSNLIWQLMCIEYLFKKNG